MRPCPALPSFLGLSSSFGEVVAAGGRGMVGGPICSSPSFPSSSVSSSIGSAGGKLREDSLTTNLGFLGCFEAGSSCHFFQAEGVIGREDPKLNR